MILNDVELHFYRALENWLEFALFLCYISLIILYITHTVIGTTTNLPAMPNEITSKWISCIFYKNELETVLFPLAFRFFYLLESTSVSRDNENYCIKALAWCLWNWLNVSCHGWVGWIKGWTNLILRSMRSFSFS